MKTKQFNQIVKKQCESIKRVLLQKGSEYASAEDRFHNFNEGAIEVKLPRLKYAESLMQKHITSVRDIINQWDSKKPSPAMLDEKMGDFINYLILIKGLMLEEMDNHGD